jgi:hypothetical protein
MPMRVTFSTDGSSSDEVFDKPHHGTQMPLGAVHPNNPGPAQSPYDHPDRRVAALLAMTVLPASCSRRTAAFKAA